MAHIAIAVPVRPSANSGNDVTAGRWAELLAASGHTVDIVAVDQSPDAVMTFDELARVQLLIALHARRSAPAVDWWTQNRPDRPVVVALAGTDLYRDMPTDKAAMTAVGVADALIALQSNAAARLTALNPTWAAKTHTIHQSVSLNRPERATVDGEFRVVVLAHLRPVKDPLLAARAARLLPAESTVVVHHAGRAHDAAWAAAANQEGTQNPRYIWHQELAANEALKLLASADVLACTSHSEGGANVVTEAIALGVPVVGTRIDGNTGLLGTDHPGLFPVGNADALADLLRQLESSPALLGQLTQRSLDRQSITQPATEQAALAKLIDSLLVAR